MLFAYERPLCQERSFDKLQSANKQWQVIPAEHGFCGVPFNAGHWLNQFSYLGVGRG
jgi:hypothetical protein